MVLVIVMFIIFFFFFFFSSRRRHTRSYGDWSSDVCSSDLLCVRDREHFSRGVEGHHGIRGMEKRRETARARTQVEDALSRLDSPHLDESAQPEPAIGRVVRADGVVARRPPRIVDRHASCKCPTAYEPSGNRDDDRGIQYHADREGF